MQVSFSAVEMLTLAQPAWISSVNCWGLRPDPPCSAWGMPAASWICLTRSASGGGAERDRPWALPSAGAKTSIPVRSMKSMATASGWVSATASEPMPSSTPVIDSISPSTSAPWERASAATPMGWPGVSSPGGAGVDAVFQAGDRFDLAFDLGAVGTGLGDHLDGLAEVLLDGQGGCVEEYAVPAAS